MNEDLFQQAKAQANARAAAYTGSGPATPTAAVSGAATASSSTSFPGLSSNGVTTPSDSTGDASPTQQVEMVNSALAVFPNASCGGPCGGPASVPLYVLVGASLSDCVFDPQVAWDQSWGRWIFVMTAQHPSTPGGCTGGNANITEDRLVVGWTYTSDANDFNKANVCWLAIDRGSNLDDFPKLGHDDNSIVVGANIFANYGQGSFLYSEVWVVGKPSNVSATNGCGIGGPLVKSAVLGSTVFTPVPAHMTDSSPVDYIIASQQPGGGAANNLFVWQSSLTGGVTFVGYFKVADYQLPPDVPQPSTGTASCATSGTCLDSSDARLTQAIGHYDPDTGYEAVWTQHAISNSLAQPRSLMRWYELVPATGSVRQSGNVGDPNLYMFNGAVSPTVAGNQAVIVYNAGDSAADGFVSFRARSRNSLAPLGTMSNETVLAAGTVSDADFSCGASRSPATTTPCRWGDYSAARPDPANANAVWGFEMLTGSGGTTTSAGWSTQVADVVMGCTGVQLASAALANGVVQFTASSTTGCSNPQYQFYFQPPGGNWTVVQPWSGKNVWTWNTNSYRPGTYNVDVWANQYGDSTAAGESFALTQWSIPACTAAGVAANFIPPQPSGTHVTLTATSTCPDPNPQYEFWLLPPGGSWSVVQPYSPSATYSWDTTGDAPGNYHFSVWVRDATSSGAFGTPPYTYDAYAPLDFGLSSAPPCTGMTASASPATSATVGTSVTVTGAATGCPNPRYEFWLLSPGGGWSLAQTYSASPSYPWKTSGLPAGTYRFSVWARDAASASSYDAYSGFQYSLTIGPCTGMSASTAPASTTTVGTKVTVTGSATGCTNPQYEFWLLPPGGSWTPARGYSSSATFDWSTTGAAAGTYHFSVWARDASSSASYDSFSTLDYSLTTAPCTGMSASAAPPTSATAGTAVVITGAATGCPNALYEFWVLPPGGTWTPLRGYSAGASFTWSTAGLPPGSYQFSVWARDASSAGTKGSPPYTYDAFSGLQYTLS
jgi:hypothetical protein